LAGPRISPTPLLLHLPHPLSTSRPLSPPNPNSQNPARRERGEATASSDGDGGVGGRLGGSDSSAQQQTNLDAEPADSNAKRWSIVGGWASDDGDHGVTS